LLVINRSLKSLWHSDVVLGASVGAVTSGLLVVLALVVAPLLGGSSKSATANPPSGVANLPGPAEAAPVRDDEGDREKRDKQRDRGSVTRRNDSASLPGSDSLGPDDASGSSPKDRKGSADSVPVRPGTTITQVPVGAGLQLAVKR
jgi:hypothetical protein